VISKKKGRNMHENDRSEIVKSKLIAKIRAGEPAKGSTDSLWSLFLPRLCYPAVDHGFKQRSNFPSISMKEKREKKKKKTDRSVLDLDLTCNSQSSPSRRKDDSFPIYFYYELTLLISLASSTSPSSNKS